MTNIRPERFLLIVEDDATFASLLKRLFEIRGYRVQLAASIEMVQKLFETESPGYAIVDLKLGTASGLTVVQQLHARDPEMLIVVLSGFPSIVTAVGAIKLGACNYL